MDLQLRVIFLVVGLLILVGVTIDLFRRRNIKADEFNNQLLQETPIEPDPELDFHYEHDETETEVETGANLNLDLDFEDAPEPEPIPLSAKDLITVHIISRDPSGFKWADLSKALGNANLHIGKNKIFYRYENDNGTGDPLFSLAKAVEPGYFEVDDSKPKPVPGVTLIMLPSTLKNPTLALDKLIRAAKQISFVLNGELLDHTRAALTLMTIDKYREQLQAN